MVYIFNYNKIEAIDFHFYFIFICFFTFYDAKNILSLMLSICHINSNFCITEEQVNCFVDKFDFPIIMYSDLQTHLDHHKMHISDCNKDPYSIKSFADYFLGNSQFISYLESFRLLNIYNITNFPQLYSNIIQRRYFFASNFGNRYSIPPKESCVFRIYRTLFTDLPPPYSFDYYPAHINDDMYIHITINIKQFFVNGIFRSTQRSSHLSSKRCVSGNNVSTSSRPRVLSDGYLSLINVGSNNTHCSKSTTNFVSPKFGSIPTPTQENPLEMFN